MYGLKPLFAQYREEEEEEVPAAGSSAPDAASAAAIAEKSKGKVGYAEGNEPVSAEREAAASANRQPLPPEPSWASFDPELERLCRMAAHIGGSQPAPISYTALIIAFLWGDDPVSTWFERFCANNNPIDLNAILRSKDVTPQDRERFRDAAANGTLPGVDPLYSRSVRNLLDQAVRVAREVARSEQATLTLAPRHVMAAYAFRNPSDHVDQVRGWGFDVEAWRREFLLFIGTTHGQTEDWTRLGQPTPSTAPIIGSFTPDDPLAPPRDLLGVEDEAAAFARIAAARSVQPPLAIGVFGEWGSGKTFFMRRIHDTIKTLSDDAQARSDARIDTGPFLPDIVQIRFNAWHYIESNLWASLVEYIFTELDRWLQGKSRNNAAAAEQIFNRLATAQQLKLDALESVITCRAERNNAELRAQHARREYEEALVRAAGVGSGTYARALMDTLLDTHDVKTDVEKIGDALGVPELGGSSARVLDVLTQARSEVGRAQLVMRAGIARLGKWPWVAALVVVLVVLPFAAVALRDGIAVLLNWPGIKTIHETVLGFSAVLAGAAAWGGALLRSASGALKKIDDFDKVLRTRTEQQIAGAQSGPAAASKTTAEDDVRKRKQILDAAEHALSEAETRLNRVRSDFENASARSRLNAFIRAKATDGDYAKHLGIIAAIRRDFGQLAALMDAANDPEQQAERRRVAQETYASVVRFCERIAAEPGVRLTSGEVRSLLTLLDKDQVATLLNERRAQLTQWLADANALAAIEAELAALHAAQPKISRIILYIDDLDRCSPKVVVDVLQAVHLLLCFPLFTVVVAVDARWVSRALHEQYPNLLGESGRFADNGMATVGAGASSHDYLEKIFQIPYWVRPVDGGGAQRYVNSLVERDVRRIGVASASGRGGTSATPALGVASNQVNAAAGAHAANAAGASASPGVTPTPPPGAAAPTAAAVGLELTRWEADALERFAPLIGATPRRLIRFVNLYRLLKTGLSGDTLRRLVGERGESDIFRALIVQLAIVTGAPNTAQAYFRHLGSRQDDEAIGLVHDGLDKDSEFKKSREAQIVLAILAAARDWPGAKLSVKDLRATASTARRYSFTAWGT